MADNELEVLIKLKDELSSAIRRPAEETRKLGQQLENIGNKAGAGFRKLNDSFIDFERSQAKMAQKLANTTNRLLSLQIVVSQLGTVFGGEATKGLAAASQGLSTFGAIVGLSPTPVGLLVGSVAGLSTALLALTGPSEAAKKKMEEFRDVVKRTEEALKESQIKEQLAEMFAPDRLSGNIEKTKAKIEEQKIILEGALREQQKIQEQMDIIQAEENERNRDRKAPGLVNETMSFWSDIFSGHHDAGKFKQDMAILKLQMDEIPTRVDRAKKKIQELNKELTNTTTQKKAVEAPKNLMKEFGELQEKLSTGSKNIQQSLDMGLIEPMEAAKEATKRAEEEFRFLQEHAEKLRKVLGPEYYKELLDGAAEGVKISRARVKGMEDEKKAAEEAGKEREKQLEKERELLKRMSEEGSVGGGFQNALKDFQDKFFSFKDQFLNIFNTMESSFSNAIDSMISDGASLRDAMKGFFGDIKKAFLKMLSDLVARKFMEAIFGGGPRGVGGAGGILGSLGLGAAGVAGPGSSGSGAFSIGAGMPSFVGGAGGQGLFSGGALGIGSLGTLGLAGIGMAGVGYGQSAGGAGGAASGAIGGALTGLAVGGPIGAIIGGLAGGAIGLFGGDDDAEKEKEKAKQAQAAQAQAMQKVMNRDYESARGLLETNLRSDYGGGLATEEAAGQVAGILSGGISNQEIDAYERGDYEALTGRRPFSVPEFESPGISAPPTSTATGTTTSGGQVVINNPTFTIQANLASSYDANKVGEDIMAGIKSAASQSAALTV